MCTCDSVHQCRPLKGLSKLCVCYMNTQTLRKRERKTKQHKATQHNTTQDLRQLFPKKRLHSGGTRTHASRILGVMLYQLSYWGSSAGWVRNHLYKPIQSKARQSEHLNLINRWIQTSCTCILCTCTHVHVLTWLHPVIYKGLLYQNYMYVCINLQGITIYMYMYIVHVQINPLLGTRWFFSVGCSPL